MPMAEHDSVNLTIFFLVQIEVHDNIADDDDNIKDKPVGGVPCFDSCSIKGFERGHVDHDHHDAKHKNHLKSDMRNYIV